MKVYQHSKAFDTLKTTTESISSNLTTLQYLQTLDHFLWQSLRPIAAECPSLFFNYLAKIVARQSLKASAKLTSDDRAKLPIHLFNTLTTKDINKAFLNARLMYINRGLLFGFIAVFRNRLTEYANLHSGVDGAMPSSIRRTLIHRVEQSIGLRPGGNLHSALLQVIYWDNKARWFKSLIVEKYTRMAILQARVTYKDFNHYTPLDDIVQTYLVVVNRAIDRCDSRQGVLTTFIQNWFKSARGEIAKLSEGQTDQSYDCLVTDHGDAAHEIIGVINPNTDAELQQHIAFISKAVDPVGLVRTYLGIQEFVPISQKQILMRLAL